MKRETLLISVLYGLSGLSDGLFGPVALWAVQSTGNSPWLISLSGLSIVLPRFVLMYLGNLIDRFGLLPSFGVLNAAALGVTATVLVEHSHIMVVRALLLIDLFIITTLWQEVRMTGKAVVSREPQIERRVKINGRLFAVQNIFLLAGLGLSALLFLGSHWFREGILVEIILLAMGLSVALIMTRSFKTESSQQPAAATGSIPYLFGTIGRLWRGAPETKYVLSLALLANTAMAPLGVGLPTLLRRNIAAHGSVYSIVTAARSMGNVVGVLGSELGSHVNVFLGSAIGGVIMGSGYASLGFLRYHAFVLAGAALLVVGFGNFLVESYLTAFWQDHAPEGSRSQFFGSIMLMFALAHPIGLGLYGILGGEIKISWLFAIGGAGEGLFGIGILVLWLQAKRRRSQRSSPTSQSAGM